MAEPQPQPYAKRRPRLRYLVAWLKRLLPAPLREAFIMREFITGPAASQARSLRA